MAERARRRRGFGYGWSDRGWSDQDFLASLRADGYVADEKLNEIHLGDYSPPSRARRRTRWTNLRQRLRHNPCVSRIGAWKNLDLYAALQREDEGDE